MNDLRILDTDHLSLMQRGNPFIIQRLNKFNPQNIAITIITATEQLVGRLNVINRATSSNDLVFAYARLKDTLEDLNNLNVLAISHDAAKFTLS